MLFVLDVAVGTVSGLVSILPLLVVYHTLVLRKNRAVDGRTRCIYVATGYVFCAVLIAVLAITGIPDAYSMRAARGTNAVPFIDFFTNIEQYILNVVLFVPLGFLLPALWEGFAKKRTVLAAGFLLSLLIEVLQIFSYRVTDVDDLIMNTLGALAGYLLFALAQGIFRGTSALSAAAIKRRRCEPCIYAAFALCGMLFVQPFIFRWMWKIAYR